MNRNEFLDKLQHALGNDLEAPLVRENVEYYRSYIQEELSKGRREEDVLEELGDPWVVAQTIIDAKLDDRAEYVEPMRETYGYRREDSVDDEYGYGRTFGGNIHTFTLDSWKSRVILILGIVLLILVIGGILSIVGGILSLVAPVLFPVLAVLVVIRIIKGMRR